MMVPLRLGLLTVACGEDAAAGDASCLDEVVDVAEFAVEGRILVVKRFNNPPLDGCVDVDGRGGLENEGMVV